MFIGAGNGFYIKYSNKSLSSCNSYAHTVAFTNIINEHTRGMYTYCTEAQWVQNIGPSSHINILLSSLLFHGTILIFLDHNN